MLTKKIAFLSVAAFIVIAASVALYFKYWQEPKAEYVETYNPKLLQVRSDLNELKSELKKKGLYNCCIRNDCNWCAIYMGHCPCAELITEKGEEKSCPECAAAWNRKQGKIPGVDHDAIKVTTFGIYGFEKGGRHHHDKEEQHHHEEKGHH